MAVAAVAAVLDRLIEINTKSNISQQLVMSKFTSVYPPAVSVLEYLERILKFARCSDSCFVVALIYIDRIIETRNIVISNLNVHRILIASILLAAKFLDDLFYNNSYYAKLGGITTQEMNTLELEFLHFIAFSLNVSSELFSKYEAELRGFVAGTRPTQTWAFRRNFAFPHVKELCDPGSRAGFQPQYQHSSANGWIHESSELKSRSMEFSRFLCPGDARPPLLAPWASPAPSSATSADVGITSNEEVSRCSVDPSPTVQSLCAHPQLQDSSVREFGGGSGRAHPSWFDMEVGGGEKKRIFRESGLVGSVIVENRYALPRQSFRPEQKFLFPRRGWVGNHFAVGAQLGIVGGGGGF